MASESCWPPKRRRLVQMRADGFCSVVTPISGNDPITAASSQCFNMPTLDESPNNGTPVAASLSHNIKCQNSSANQKWRTATSSLEMEGEMVEQALDSVVKLPDAVNQVVLMHKDQSTEIQQQQYQLNTLKESLKEGQILYERTLQDIAQITRRIYLTEDQVLEKKRLCKSHETNLTVLLSRVEETRAKLERSEEEKKVSLEKLEQYKNKMKAHEKCTLEYEKEFPVQKRLREIEDKVTKLLSLKEEVESNKVEAEKISSGRSALQLKQQKAAMEKKCQIAQQLSKQKEIKQSTDVLHKRNAAQLTRLKRQLKEVQAHNRQWQDQAVKLENSVTRARKQLEE